MVMETPAEKLEILLVDDRPENLLALEAVLNSPEYTLIRANSGDEALKHLLDHEPALILMDVQMPDLSGFETANIIKKSERLRDVPIIFITAINKDERYAVEGYEHGAVDYIFKPYDATVLRSKVAVFADLWKKTRRLVQVEKQLRETERREKERQIAQLELRNLKREQAEQKRYRELVEGIEHGIVWAADAFSLRVSFASPSSLPILGFPPEQWTNEDDFFFHHIHPEDLKRFLDTVKKVHDTKQPERIQHRFINAKGATIWVSTGLRIARNTDDTSYEIRGLSTDVTRIKEAEDILRKNKLRSDLLAEASLTLSESLDATRVLSKLGSVLVPAIADGYVVEIPHEDGTIRTLALTRGKTASSKAAQKMADRRGVDPYTEISAPEAFRTEKPVLYRDVTDPHLREIAQDENHFEQLREIGFGSAISVPLRTREKIFGVLTLLTSDSGRRYDETDLALAEDLAHRVGSALDNAELYRRAQEAVNARDEFLSVASHELKTPLTPLKLNTQSLVKTLRKNPDSLPVDKVLKMLETSDRQVNRLARLVEDLLDVSRISIGRLSIIPEDFDLVDLCRDILERYRDQFAALKCEIIFRRPDEVLVHWDRTRIEQVIINLLTNAMKYGAGKPVELTLEMIDGKVRMTFRDHGIGIAPENHAKIFGRFERAVGGKYYAGLGLGLYIVQEILRVHGGEISVESVPQQGATFTVEIPARVEAPVDTARAGLSTSRLENTMPHLALPAELVQANTGDTGGSAIGLH